MMGNVNEVQQMIQERNRNICADYEWKRKLSRKGEDMSFGTWVIFLLVALVFLKVAERHRERERWRGVDEMGMEALPKPIRKEKVPPRPSPEGREKNSPPKSSPKGRT